MQRQNRDSWVSGARAGESVENTPMTERRKFTRFVLPTMDVRCRIKRGVPLFGRRIPVELLNISASGFRGETAGNIGMGNVLEGTLDILETRDRLKFHGEVCWARMGSVEFRGQLPLIVFGLKFIKFGVDSEAKLEAMRRWFTSDRYKKTSRRYRHG